MTWRATSCQALNGGGEAALQQTLVRTLNIHDIVVVSPPEEQEGAAARVHRARSWGRRIILAEAATAAGAGAWAAGLWDGENHRHGREIGCFEFQSAADRAVFQTLVADLRSGAYRSADRHQRRALLKRGSEGGGAWKTQSESGLGHGLGQGLRHEHGKA